jgi:hypothetical protein
MNDQIVLSALVGGLLGMRHAFEPDHVAAMITLSASGTALKAGQSSPRRFRDFSIMGAMWGLGHTLGLLLVVLTLSLINRVMSAQVTQLLELLVAVMLVALGIRSIAKSYAGNALTAPSVLHHHGDCHHCHAAGSHMHIGARIILWRPLLIGSVHGLAGSGAMLVLVAASIDSVIGRCAYVLMFGLGSVLGMSAMTVVSGVGFARLLPIHQAWIARASGALSIIVGAWLGYAAA